MTQLTIYTLDGSAELEVDADLESLDLQSKVAQDAGDLFHATLTVTVGTEAAQQIECVIDEGEQKIYVTAELLAELRGETPEEIPAPPPDPMAEGVEPEPPAPWDPSPEEVEAAEVADAEPPPAEPDSEGPPAAPPAPAAAAAEEPAQPAAAEQTQPAAPPAPAAEAEEPAQPAAAEQTPPAAPPAPAAAEAAEPAQAEVDPAVTEAEPVAAAADDATEQYHEQLEQWILGQAPLVVYDAADTSRSMNGIAWVDGTNRQDLGPGSWSLQAMVTKDSADLPGGPHQLTIVYNDGSYVVYLAGEHFDALAAAPAETAEGWEGNAAAEGTRLFDEVLLHELEAGGVVYQAGGEVAQIEVDWADLAMSRVTWTPVTGGWTGPLSPRVAGSTDEHVASAIVHAAAGETIWLEIFAAEVEQEGAQEPEPAG